MGLVAHAIHLKTKYGVGPHTISFPRIQPPGGANDKPMQVGHTVMVDMGGNFNGYMCDMRRVFSIGKTTDEAYAAHQLCIDIQHEVINLAKLGAVCEDFY